MEDCGVMLMRGQRVASAGSCIHRIRFWAEVAFEY